SLSRSLRAGPEAAEAISECVAPLTRGLVKDVAPPLAVCEAIEATLVDEPPASGKGGGRGREGAPGASGGGVIPRLDGVRAARPGGRTTIAAIEERERARTGIASLKV